MSQPVALERNEYVNPHEVDKKWGLEHTKVQEELKHRYPGGMSHYERSWLYQIFMLLLLFFIAVSNTRLNFEMIKVFNGLIEDLKSLKNPDEIDEGLVLQMEQTFNSTSKSDTCDILYFSNEFKKQDLIDALTTLLRIVEASAYISVGFGIWITFLLRILSSYNLVTEDFSVTPAEQIVEKRRESLIETAAGIGHHDANNKEVIDLGKIIRTQAGEKHIVQETEGEKKIRIYLKSETVIFGFNQIIQDIPQATAAVLYLLFLTRTRGVLCYEAFTEGQVENSFSVDKADPIALGQLAIILFSIFVNMVINLAPRWITYFHYRTVKNAKAPTSTTVRLSEVAIWTGIYLIAIFLPLFVVLYSPVGTELLGLNTTNSVGILVLIIFSAVSLLVGSLSVCCFWGRQFTEGICFCLIVFDAVNIGCDACFDIEICEFMPSCGCC